MENKTKNLFIWTFGAVAVVGIAVLLTSTAGFSGSGPAAYSTSVLTAAERYYDFDTIQMYDGDVVHRFIVQNNGAEPVVINKVYTSCMCTTAEITDEMGEGHGTFGMQGHGLPSRTDVSVGPGESVFVDAIFNPAAHGPAGVGLAERTIYIETNSTASPKLELSFRAMVAR